MNKSKQVSSPQAPRSMPAFVPAQALAALHADILDEAAVRRWVLAALHPDGPRCPHCQTETRAAQQAAYWNAARIQCPGCGRWFTALTRTMLHGCKLGLRQIYLLAVCLALGLGTKQAATAAGVSAETARLWAERFGQLGRLMEASADA